MPPKTVTTFGCSANLPKDAVIECPAIADSAGMRQVIVGALPSAVAGILAMRFGWVEVAGKLADELLAAQKEYLPQFAD